ncbi:hypothetical protein Lepto782_22315 (plasmid) [Leptospira interrogans serovar Canicola]|uniref:Uncharacterized protein n=1 Tax=Leptospira interrogans serovar Canicola TaxID=211880 RepID=A0AAQ0B0W8_LEPIR|nr:hypothetical protein Lepto782_22315 [Leptospira interrogans serovar Canicola]
MFSFVLPYSAKGSLCLPVCFVNLSNLFFHYILYFESVFCQFYRLFSSQIISFYHMSVLSAPQHTRTGAMRIRLNKRFHIICL